MLWPIFHDVMTFLTNPDAKPFNEDDWACYQRINTVYADVVIRTSHQSDLFWVHDYHLLLLPQYLTRKVRTANVGLFIHTPFPSHDIFKCLPVRKEVLRAMLCADLVGFQLFEHARKFFVTLKRILYLEHQMLPNGQIAVDYGGRNVIVKVSHVCLSFDEVVDAAKKMKEIQQELIQDMMKQQQSKKLKILFIFKRK